MIKNNIFKFYKCYKVYEFDVIILIDVFFYFLLVNLYYYSLRNI